MPTPQPHPPAREAAPRAALEVPRAQAGRQCQAFRAPSATPRRAELLAPPPGLRQAKDAATAAPRPKLPQPNLVATRREAPAQGTVARHRARVRHQRSQVAQDAHRTSTPVPPGITGDAVGRASEPPGELKADQRAVSRRSGDGRAPDTGRPKNAPTVPHAANWALAAAARQRSQGRRRGQIGRGWSPPWAASSSVRTRSCLVPARLGPAAACFASDAVAPLLPPVRACAVWLSWCGTWWDPFLVATVMAPSPQKNPTVAAWPAGQDPGRGAPGTAAVALCFGPNASPFCDHLLANLRRTTVML